MNKINNIPVFSKNSFFKENQRVHIHLSTDFPDYVGVMHKHEFIEVVYILSGSSIHFVGEKNYKVSSGDVVLINSGVPHSFCPCDDGGNFVAYDLMFTPDFIDSSAIKMGDFKSLKDSFLFYSLFPEEHAAMPDLHVTNTKLTNYSEIFNRIYNEYVYGEKGFTQIIRAYSIELIIKIFRDIEREGKATLSTENKKTVERALSFIQENYNLSISVGDIATQVFLSPDYFRKLFKKVTGISVINYLQKMRLEKACTLLKTTDLSIKDVCSQVGYTDLQAFYKIFKKVIGTTPQNYRNSQ